MKVQASTDGEAYREIASGTYANGSFEFPSATEAAPQEVMNGLNRFKRSLTPTEPLSAHEPIPRDQEP